jgi:hypothetical protein
VAALQPWQALPTDAFDRILAARAAGARVVFLGIPDAEVSPPSASYRFAIRAAAAVAVILVSAIGLAQIVAHVVWLPNTSGQTGGSAMGPADPPVVRPPTAEPFAGGAGDIARGRSLGISRPAARASATRAGTSDSTPPTGTGVSAEAGAVPTWTLRREVQFGNTNGSIAQLGMPQAATLAPNGHVMVFDYKGSQIKEFDAQGSFLRAIGRPGVAAGEFRNVHSLGFLGDTLWASDVDANRVTLFPPGARSPIGFAMRYPPARLGDNGQFVSGLQSSTPLAMLTSGVGVAQSALLFLGQEPIPLDLPAPIVLLRRDGSIADTVASPVIHHGRDLMLDVKLPNGSKGGGFIVDQPFEAGPFWGARPDGRGLAILEAPIVAPSTVADAAFTVRTTDSTGRIVRSRSYSYQPVPVTTQVRDGAVRAVVARAFEADAEQQVRAAMVVPAFMPPVTALVAGRDGSIWIRREAVGNTAIRGGTWNVIDPAGTLVAVVTMPTDLWVLYADMDQLLGVERDTAGIQSVVRYRVVRG